MFTPRLIHFHPPVTTATAEIQKALRKVEANLNLNRAFPKFHWNRVFGPPDRFWGHPFSIETTHFKHSLLLSLNFSTNDLYEPSGLQYTFRDRNRGTSLIKGRAPASGDGTNSTCGEKHETIINVNDWAVWLWSVMISIYCYDYYLFSLSFIITTSWDLVTFTIFTLSIATWPVAVPMARSMAHGRSVRAMWWWRIGQHQRCSYYMRDADRDRLVQGGAPTRCKWVVIPWKLVRYITNKNHKIGTNLAIPNWGTTHSNDFCSLHPGP